MTKPNLKISKFPIGRTLNLQKGLTYGFLKTPRLNLKSLKRFNLGVLIVFAFSFFLTPIFVDSATTVGVTQGRKGTGLGYGLVGHWTFDGKDMRGGTVWDASGNNNNGSMINMATSTSYIRGKMGQALNFDGVNDYVDVGSGTSLDDLDTKGGMTVAFWIKPASIITSSIIAKGLAANGNGSWGIAKTSTTDPARLTFTKEGSTDSNINYNSTLNVGVWQHIVVTWNGSMTFSTGVGLYKNGVKVTQPSATDGATANSDASNFVSLGAAGVSGGSQYSDEILDDVRIYNRVLSSSEIINLYKLGGETKMNISATPPNIKSGLVGHWTFDGKDMRGGTVWDASGNGYNARAFSISTSTFYTDGKLGQGLNFDGVNDYIKTDSSVTLNTNKISLAFWYRNPPTATSVTVESSTNFGSNAGTFVFGLLDSGGCSGTGFHIGHNGDSGANTACFNRPVGDGWHHVVMINDVTQSTGSEIQLYVDGVVQTRTSSPNTAENGTGNFSDQIVYIGSRAGTTFFSKSVLDDVRIYNRALSASEIQLLYKNNLANMKNSPTLGIVQSASTYTTLSPQSKTFSRPNTKGNIITIYTQTGDGTCTVAGRPTIADSNLNTYIQISNRCDTPGRIGSYLAYANNIAGGANTVTVTSNSGSDLGFHISEWSGIDINNPLIATSSNQGTGTSYSSGTTTISVKRAILFAGGGEETSGGSLSATGGYTLLTQQGGHLSGSSYKIATSSGEYQASMTGTTGAWMMHQAAFRPVWGAK